MKNSKIIFAVIAVIGILGVSTFIVSQSSTRSESMVKKDEVMMPKDNAVMEAKDEAMMKNDDAIMDKSDTMMHKSEDKYVEYSKATLESASSNRRVLFFYASWCPTCKPADADLKTNTDKFPTDVMVIRVNYNDTETDQDEKDLAIKYGITYQHTFVQIDEQGNEITKWNGGKTDELLAKIK